MSRRHLTLVRSLESPAPARALDDLRTRVVEHLREAGVRLSEREMAALTEAVLAEAVSVAIAWLETA